MQVEALTISVLEQVYAIEQQAHRYPWSKQALASAFLHNTFFGAYHDHTLVGFAIVLNACDVLELLNLAVAPLYQHQGYGRQLLHGVIAAARKEQIPRVLLEVRASNQPALSLYQHYGFVTTRRRPSYYPAEQGREDALVMEYAL